MHRTHCLSEDKKQVCRRTLSPEPKTVVHDLNAQGQAWSTFLTGGPEVKQSHIADKLLLVFGDGKNFKPA